MELLTEEKLNQLKSRIDNISEFEKVGEVTAIKGNIIECKGLSETTAIGNECNIINTKGRKITCQVTGFQEDSILLLPYGETKGINIGAIVKVTKDSQDIFPDESWKGRVINGYGEAMDNKGPLTQGYVPYPLQNNPPEAGSRKRVGSKIDLGVRVIDTFASCCYGQRMGIFSGSGVGKSVLISMLTKYADTDIKIIGLIGERGREVQEFISEYLGEEGLKNAIVVVSTGDEPALLRKQATYITMTLAEYFRDQGKEVLCIIDSITRFATAQREIGLSTGEPPSTKGYTPSVFSELPKILERAGPGKDKGNITGLFSVLVEGDDQNEPISDTVRGIVDGHVVLDRNIAEKGRFPAVNILKSISRTMPGCNSEKENQLVRYGRKIISTYEDMEEMIKIGAYKKGSNSEVDVAIDMFPKLESFLTQSPGEHTNMDTSYKLLAEILQLKEFYEGSEDNNQTS